MLIAEIYRCLQGEGKLLGTPSILVRTSSCNLRCKWGDTYCDTYYTSWKPEGKMMQVPEIVSKVVELAKPNIRHVIISGGEPTLQKDLKDLHRALWRDLGFHITVETNGTHEINLAQTLFSVSPKLKSSVPVGTKWASSHERARINVPVLAQLLSQDSYLKFVVAKEEDLSEIQSIVLRLENILGDSIASQVYLMPEGYTQEAIRKKQQWVAETAQKLGYRYSPRLHIDIYGDKRGV